MGIYSNPSYQTQTTANVDAPEFMLCHLASRSCPLFVDLQEKMYRLCYANFIMPLEQYKMHRYARANGLKNKRAYAKQTYRTPAYSRYSPATEVV